MISGSAAEPKTKLFIQREQDIFMGLPRKRIPPRRQGPSAIEQKAKQRISATKLGKPGTQHRVTEKKRLKAKKKRPVKRAATDRDKARLIKALEKSMAKNFPWAPQAREYKRKNFSLTVYRDNSRLYLFKGGGYLIITGDGVPILKKNPALIKRYLKGEKLTINMGGNSTIVMVSTSEVPLVVKEHHSGLSAQTQMEHMRDIRMKFEKIKSRHGAPKYYVAGNMPESINIKGAAGRRVRDISIMDFVSGRKLSTVMEELQNKGDKASMRKLGKMMQDYKGFKRSLRRRKMPITDLHHGNVLARYDPQVKGYRFTIIDQ